MSCCAQRRHQAFQRRLIERQQHGAIGSQAFGHFQPQVARDQRLRPLHVEIVLLEAMLVGDLQQIAEAGGGDQRASARPCARSAHWWQASCRGSPDRARMRRYRPPRRIACVPGDHRLVRRVMRRQQLRGQHPVRQRQHDVGEGAADIDGQADASVRMRSHRAAPYFPSPCAVARKRRSILIVEKPTSTFSSLKDAVGSGRSITRPAAADCSTTVGGRISRRLPRPSRADAPA